MGIITMDTLADALKTFYLPAIVNQMNYKINPFLSEIEQNSEEVVGSEIVMAMRYGRMGGAGNRTENGDLPTPGARKLKQVKYDTKNLFGRIMITDKMMKVGKEGKGSFANVLETMLEDTIEDNKDQFGRQLFGDGVGKLAMCTAQATVNTLTLAALSTDYEACQYFAEGLLIDILATNGTVKYEGREITMVDYTNGQITIDGTAVTTLATDFITISGNYGLELTGLAEVFKTTGTMYNVDKAVHKWIIPNIIAYNDEIDEIVIQKGFDLASRRGGGQVNFLICSDGVKRGYQNYQVLMKRNTEVLELKGGYKTLSYNGNPLTDDKYCQKKTLYGLVKEDFKIHQIGDWDWMDRDGKVLCRVSGKPAYEATLVKYGDLGCKRPAGQVKLTGITEH